MIRTLPIALACTLWLPILSAQERPPNIVLIMADDVGTEAFGCYGGTSWKTPRIDALAARGMRFTHCYSQPLCTPSRVKIMTGRSNARNYVNFSILDPRERTFAHHLRAAGYRTFCVGKWQLLGAEHYGAWAGKGTHPRGAGFDEWCLWQVDKLGSRYWKPRIDRNGELVPVTADTYGPDLFATELSQFMERNRSRPFLVYFPMALVHDPFVPTPLSDDRKSKDIQRNFGDMMRSMDGIVGRIEDELKRLDLSRNTLLLFTSDNGTHRKIISHVGERAVQGGKGRPTDAGTHVPLIASWPGTVPAGQVCEDLIDFSDFLPTLTRLAGREPPSEPKLDGVSFLEQLKGSTGTPRAWLVCWSRPRPLRQGFPTCFFARDQRFKLHADGRFFDLTLDPEERTPMPPEARSEVASRAHAKLAQALKTVPESPPGLGRMPRQER